MHSQVADGSLVVILTLFFVTCLATGSFVDNFERLEQFLQANKAELDDCIEPELCLIEAKKLLIKDESRDRERIAFKVLEDSPDTIECPNYFITFIVRLAEETDFGQVGHLVDKLATHVVKESIQHCGNSIDSLIEEAGARIKLALDNESSVIKRLLKLRNNFVQRNTYFAIGRPEFMIDPRGWAKIIKYLSNEDPKGHFTRIVKKRSPGKTHPMWLVYPDPSNFSYIYQNYLNEPCEQYNGLVGDLVRRIHSIRFYAMENHEDAKHSPNLFGELPESFQDIAYRYYVCNQVLINGIDRDSVLTALAN